MRRRQSNPVVGAGRLGEEERTRLLKTFDTLVPAIPRRPVREVDRELRAIRAARRRGGRRLFARTP